MKSLEEFETFYNKSLLATLEEIDEIRKERLKQGRIVIAGLIVSGLIVYATLISTTLSEEMVWIGIIAAVLVTIGTLFFAVKTQKYNVSYKGEFKKRVIEPIIKFISDDLTYSPSRKIDLTEFKDSRLFLSRVDRYNGDDYVDGKIDKTFFKFSEIRAEEKRTSGTGKERKETWHDIFKGLFFIADFNKEFSGSTVLIPNYLGKGNSFLKKIFGANRIEKLVKLEDPSFNKNFNCYSTNDVEARYILSPALMERITNFKNKYPKNPVYIAFVKSNVYVAITYYKDLFEPGYFRTVIDFTLVKTYFEDIKFVVDIIEEFNLNNRIWTKE